MLSLFLVSYFLLITINRDYFHYQYLSLKAFHNPERARFDHATTQKALRWAMLSLKFSKLINGLPMFSFFFVVPIPKYLMSKNITDFIGMPYQIPFLDGDSYFEVTVNIIHQLLFGWTAYIYCFFSTGYILSVFFCCFIKGQIILNFLKEKKHSEVMTDNEFKIWHDALIDSTQDLTEQLNNHYTCFSWCVYLYVKLCYITMLVLWLSIKIEPKLRVIVINFMAFVAFLYICIVLVEAESDQVIFHTVFGLPKFSVEITNLSFSTMKCWKLFMICHGINGKLHIKSLLYRLYSFCNGHHI